MKKQTILLLVLLLTCALWLTSATAEEEWVLQKTLEFGGVVRSVAFHPQANVPQLAVGTNYNDTDYNVEIYDTNTFSVLHYRDFGRDAVTSVSFRKGWYDLAVAHDRNLSIYDSLNGHVLSEHRDVVAGWIRQIAHRPDGKRLAIAPEGSRIQIWNTDHQAGDRRRLRTFNIGHPDTASVAWSPNGQRLASGGSDGTVRLWNPATGVNFAVLRGHTDFVRAVAWSPNGQMLASVSVGEPYIILWDMNTQREIRRMNSPACLSVAWSPDGQTLAIGLSSWTFQGRTSSGIALYNPNTGSRKHSLVRLGKGHLSVAFHPNGRLLAGGDDTGTVRIWKLITVNRLDVTQDERVDLNDLVEVARNYGKTGTNRADVNGDGRVDIKDLTAVAEAINPNFAAPALAQQLPTLPFTTAEVRGWIRDAKQQELDAHGIAVLEQLLAALTQAETPPEETALLVNYPNPFNPETWIPYQLAKPAEVTVSIHSADGKLVRTLALGQLPAGVYQDKSRAAYWDGTNEQGEAVASGVYFYTLKAGEFSATKKMLIRK